MGRKKQLGDAARKAATSAASVAIATSGLSSCNDNGAVDPLPPPLECNTVNAGQNLIPSAVLNDSIVTVTVTNQTPDGFWTDSVAVVNPMAVRVVEVAKPGIFSRDSLVVTLELEPSTTTNASFTLVGELAGFDGSLCAFSRTYNITVDSGAVSIGLAGGDKLPLFARQRADIVLARRVDRTVYLEARTPYRGEVSAEWTVSHGQLMAKGAQATWRLPDAPGLYQIELVMDYGNDGFAFDAMTLEVG